MNIDIEFEKKPKKNPSQAERIYQDAIYKVDHMFEISGDVNLHPNKKPRVLGHTKNQELVSWDS